MSFKDLMTYKRILIRHIYTSVISWCCCLRRATEYHNNERQTLSSSHHFCTLLRILLCHEPCFLAPVACLLPPAVAACYICCCCLPCENQARGPSGLEVILGRVLSNQFLSRLGHSLEHESNSFTRGKNPNCYSDQWVQWVGWRPRLLYALPFFSWFLSISNLSWTLHSCTERHTLAVTSSICDNNAGPHCHAGVNPLPQWICAVPVITSASILGPVCLWIWHMYASAYSLPCSRVPVFASATLLGPVSKWIWIIIHTSDNSHPCSCRIW